MFVCRTNVERAVTVFVVVGSSMHVNRVLNDNEWCVMVVLNIFTPQKYHPHHILWSIFDVNTIELPSKM